MSAKSILLIEYEDSFREILSSCLSELGGWIVTASASIREGFDLCLAAQPDVILIDASTRETDALVFIEQLKQYSANQAIPILLIASYANWFSLGDLQRMGFAGAINKPFNPSTLSAQIFSLLAWSDSS